jgi:hypothetical protein
MILSGLLAGRRTVLSAFPVLELGEKINHSIVGRFKTRQESSRFLKKRRKNFWLRWA